MSNFNFEKGMKLETSEWVAAKENHAEQERNEAAYNLLADAVEAGHIEAIHAMSFEDFFRACSVVAENVFVVNNDNNPETPLERAFDDFILAFNGTIIGGSVMPGDPLQVRQWHKPFLRFLQVCEFSSDTIQAMLAGIEGNLYDADKHALNAAARELGLPWMYTELDEDENKLLQ